MQLIEGSKNLATSDLYEALNGNLRELKMGAYPATFSWPNRILCLSSLSRVEPNLIYWGSSAFLNLGFVVLSKQRIRWSISSENGESSRKPEWCELSLHLKEMIERPGRTFEKYLCMNADEHRSVEVAYNWHIRSVGSAHWVDTHIGELQFLHNYSLPPSDLFGRCLHRLSLLPHQQ